MCVYVARDFTLLVSSFAYPEPVEEEGKIGRDALDAHQIQLSVWL